MSQTRLLILALALCVAFGSQPASSTAAAMDDITAANSAGKTVFLVLTDAAGKNLAMARDVAKKVKEATPNSAVVELNRSDPKQAAAVRKYRVAGAPVPLVMVIASNGVAAGASLVKNGAVRRLLGLVPTPAKAEYLKVLSQNQKAVIIFSHSQMILQSKLYEEMSEVVRLTKGKVVSVLVDVNDPKEHKLMTEWKIDRKSTEPTIVIMNTKGQTLGRLTGAPSAAKIIEVSKKRPCCGDPSCKGCK